jgi:hypothetical protein
MLPSETIQRMTQEILDQAEFIAAVKGIATKKYTVVSYGQGIYDAARLYWKEGSQGNFYTRMNQVIKFGLNDAWILGAADVGVEPDEFEQVDKDQIAGLINEEKSHVDSLFSFLDGLANKQDAKLADADFRLAMWANRFEDIVDQARVWFGQKTRFVWEYGDTVRHCQDGEGTGGVGCSSLRGIVAFGAEWDQVGIRPKSSALACGGYNCDCRLTPTTKRRTPKALQKLLDIMAGAHV